MTVRHVPRGDVPQAVRRAADAAVKEAARELRLAVPSIRWVDVDDGRAGWVEIEIDRSGNGPGQIFLSASLLVSEVAAWATHEVRHLWQDRESRYLGDRAGAEDDAESYAVRKTGRSVGLPYYLRRYQRADRLRG